RAATRGGGPSGTCGRRRRAAPAASAPLERGAREGGDRLRRGRVELDLQRAGQVAARELRRGRALDRGEGQVAGQERRGEGERRARVVVGRLEAGGADRGVDHVHDRGRGRDRRAG